MVKLKTLLGYSALVTNAAGHAMGRPKAGASWSCAINKKKYI